MELLIILHALLSILVDILRQLVEGPLLNPYVLSFQDT